MTTTKTNLDRLCAEKNVRLTLKAGAVPRRDDWRDAHRYKATIHVGKRRYTVPFYTGSGWTKDPTVADVMSSLLSDASCYVSTTDIDDFAEEFGYEQVTKAIAAYKSCKKTHERLTDLLGDDFDAFVESSQDY